MTSIRYLNFDFVRFIMFYCGSEVTVNIDITFTKKDSENMR